ncbi:MAG: class II glutamine amidotransferase [Proteobacteria bacterium]|nr:class II glutamine amidotransferase [Pseudomonadota bacterium]
MKSPGPFPTRHAIGGEDDDHPKEECGLFGIHGLVDAAALTVLGLHALQHRGQEAAGIVAYDGKQFHIHRALGEVGDNFNAPEIIGRLEGHMAIGHVRYSTTGETVLRNVQPLFADFKFGGLAVAHNGNLTNAYEIRQALVQRGCIFQSTSDTEIIIHLIAISEYGRVVDRMTDALGKIEGAYSLVVITQKKMIGLRDPYGVRPLVLGR